MPTSTKEAFNRLLQGPADRVDPSKLRDFGDYPSTRRYVFDQTVKAVQETPAVANDKYTLRVTDVDWKDDPRYTSKDITEALRKRKSLTRTLSGRMELVDNQTGEVVNKSGRRALMHVPYFTDEGSFLIDGTEMSFINQARLLPGIYTSQQENGTPFAQFRASQGGGFRMLMKPDTGVFQMRFGNRHMPAYHILKAVGVSDQAMKDTWGDLYKSNREQTHSPGLEKWISTQAEKGKEYIQAGEYKPSEEELRTLDERALGLRAWFNHKTLDPDVTSKTIGEAVDRVTPQSVLKASRNIVDVNKGRRNPDNKDSLQFQNFWTVGDRLAEQIRKDNNGQMRQILWKVTPQGDLSKVPTAPMDGYVSDLFVNSGNQQVLEQTNPLDMFNQASKVTWLGEGGIPGTESAPQSARNVQPSYFGYIDLLRSPESLRIGLDMHLARGVKVGPDQKLYKQFINPKTQEKEWVDMHSAARATVGYPSFYTSDADKKYVYAIDGEELSIVPRNKVDYVLPQPDDASNDLTDTVPLKSGVKGMRQLMGSKFITHALPLSDPETPLVTTPGADGERVEARLGRFAGVQRAPVEGTVQSVGKDRMTILDSLGKKHEIPLHNNRPYARKTGITSFPKVQKGDMVKKGDLLATSNYTDDEGNLAMVKNLRVGYLPWKGYQHEDAVVISESARDKLKTNQLYSPKYDITDQDLLDKKLFTSRFPSKYTPQQLENIDDQGVVKPGTVLEYGDPIYLGIRQRETDKSTLNRPLMNDASKVWDHHAPGKVVRAVPREDGVIVDVVSESKPDEADKLSIPFGSKGVISLIVPDEQMPRDEQGNPLELILPPESIASRVNPAQLSVAALGKVAEKRGNPYIVPGTLEEKSISELAEEALSSEGLKAQEDLYNPETDKVIPGISTGILPVYRMVQLAELKGKARSTGAYTAEGTPLRGGEEGAKHIGPGELTAIKSHGADKVLADLKLIHGHKNDEFWSKLKAGQTPSIPKTPEVYNKFRALLRAGGIDLQETEHGDSIYAMTDSRARELTGPRKIRNPKTYDLKMRPLKGGLFDPELTGGKFSYIELPEPVLNPIMETPVRAILGVTAPELQKIISGESEGPGLQERLKNLDLQQELNKAKEDIKNKKGTGRNQAYRRHMYLQGMVDNDVHPEDFMLTRMPVLPQEYRPITKMEDTHLVSDPNRLYRDLMYKIEDYNDVKESLPDMVPTARQALYDSVKATVGTGYPKDPKLQKAEVGGILKQLLGKGSPKHSFVQRRVIGADIDLYGLGVIAPDPKLNLDEAGIPEEQAWKVFEPFTVRNLVKKGVSPVKAVEEVQNRTTKARGALEEEVQNRPVLLNRAPTLHKYGVQAFNAKMVPGSAIRINPWVCGGYNADFDGNCCDFDTRISLTISKKALHDSPTGRQWLEELQKGESVMLDFNEKIDVDHVTLKIGEFPGIGEYVLDKNGAKVYDVPQGVFIATGGLQGHGRMAEITKFTVEENCPCVKVKTARKREVVVSDNESLAIYNKEKDTLEKAEPRGKEGGVVPVIRQVPVYGKAFNYDIGWWYGALVADGWVSEGKRTVGYAKLSKAKREKVVEIARKQICENFTVCGPYSRNPGEGGGWGQGCKIHMNGDLGQFVSPLCHSSGRGALYKTVPGILLEQGSYECVLGVFAGLLDGDATVAWNTSTKNKRPVVRFSTSSPYLVESLRKIGLKLGVRMSVTTVPARNGSKESYVVCPSIPDMYYMGVLKALRLVDEESQQIIDEMADKDFVKDDTDIIPICKEDALYLRNLFGSGDRSYYSILHKAGKTGYIGRVSLLNMLADAGEAAKELSTLSDRATDRTVVWDVIKTVEDAGTRTVYDFEIPDNKMFAIHNGLIVYDTMSITVPVTQEAVKEARAKMMPSKNLITPSGEPAYTPDQSLLQGLYLMTKEPEGRPVRVNASGKDLVTELKRMYKEGKVNIDTPVIGS